MVYYRRVFLIISYKRRNGNFCGGVLIVMLFGEGVE